MKLLLPIALLTLAHGLLACGGPCDAAKRAAEACQQAWGDAEQEACERRVDACQKAVEPGEDLSNCLADNDCKEEKCVEELEAAQEAQEQCG